MEKTISISGCVLILTVYIARLFYMADPFHIFPLLTAVWLGVCWWHRPLRPTPIDICLVALWAYGMLAPTVNPIGSMAATSRLTASVLIYFTARTIFALYGAAGRRMLAVLTAGIVMMTAAALFQFGMFADIDNGTPPEPQRDIESLTDAGYKIKCMEWYGTLPAKRNQ